MKKAGLSKLHQLMVFSILVAFANSVNASQDVDSTVGMIMAAMGPALNKLTATAISWLGVFSVLQWIMTNYSVLKGGGDIQAAIAKTAGLVAWIAVCLYLINNGPEFISKSGNALFSILGVLLVGPGTIMAAGIGMASAMVGLGILAGVASNVAGQLLLLVALLIFGISCFFACKIFMVQLEVGLVAMMSPLSFSFLGLSALRDQGIAPFKALISLAYRIIMLTLVISAFSEVGSVLSRTLSELTVTELVKSGATAALKPILAAFGAYVVLAYLLYRSDSIAASLSSGSTNMGTGDVAAAAAAGAAVGAAVMSGGAGGAALAGQAPAAMSDFLKSLGSSGSVTNALGSGAGGADVPPPSTPKASALSMPAAASTTASAPGSDGTTRGMPREDAVKLATRGSFGPPMSGTSPASPPATATPASPPATATPASPPATASPASPPATATPASPPATASPASPPARATPAPAPARATPASASASATPASASASATPAGQPMGSGEQAGIQAPGSQLESTLGDLNKTMAAMQQRRAPGFRERLGQANAEIAREQAGTSVSINPNQVD